MPVKHGHGGRGKQSPTYISWHLMKQRCLNPNSPVFKWYGGKGVTVCDQWLEFVNFLEDMGERPGGYEISRLDHAKDYEPGNVMWELKADHNTKNHRMPGESNPNAQLTSGEVWLIRRLKGTVTQVMIAKMFKKSYWQINKILTGRRWKTN